MEIIEDTGAWSGVGDFITAKYSAQGRALHGNMALLINVQIYNFAKSGTFYFSENGRCSILDLVMIDLTDIKKSIIVKNV